MKKKTTLEKLTPLVLGACLLTVVTSCGSDDDDSSSSSTQQPEEQTEGQFRVVLSPVNPDVAGTGTGTGEFTISGDEFRAVINVDDAPNAAHPQHIHVGTRCPAASDDTNGDGFIDAVEASAASGGILIPLDSDLRAQSSGSDNMSGASYDYNEQTSFQTMLADLRLPDTDTSDEVVKLGPDEDLNLEGKVVEVHGVPDATTLPATVQGSDGDSPQAALPVLCGVITRVADGSTTGDTGTTTGDTGTTTGDTGTTTGDTGTTTGETGTTTGTTGTTTGTR